MYVAEAQVKSERAAIYLAQLCKHFSHKVPTEYGENYGCVSFQPGRCTLRAANDLLSMRCEAASERDLQLVKDVMADHLARFAWREKPAVMWMGQPMPAPDC